MLSLFKSGIAKTWKEQYIQSQDGRPLVLQDDWERSKTLLRSGFPEIGRVQEALQELQQIRQGKMNVDELNTKFRLLVAKAGLNATANLQILIHMYEQAINRDIGKQIILAGAPDDLDGWMTIASKLDGAYNEPTGFLLVQLPMAQRNHSNHGLHHHTSCKTITITIKENQWTLTDSSQEKQKGAKRKISAMNADKLDIMRANTGRESSNKDQ